MIIYLHGFDSSSPGNHEKVLQLKFIDDDVRFINYSTLHPRHDMQFLLNEVHKLVSESKDKKPLICGVGLGGYWAERIGFLCGIKQAIFNPKLLPQENMGGTIDRPAEYEDVVLDSQRSSEVLSPYYDVIWDAVESHKFKQISHHLQAINAFKQSEL